MFSITNFLNPFQSKGLKILTYHGVVNAFTHSRLQRNFHTLEQFKEQITYLKKNRYKFLNDVELIEIAQSNPILKSQKLIYITFDDGYQNNLTAIEELNRLKVPATIFVSTEAINTNHSIWTVNLSLLLLEGNAKMIVFNNEEFSLENYEARLNTFNSIRYFLKEVDGHNRKVIFDAILSQFPANELERLIEKHDYFKMLTWEEIRSVQSDSIQFQSHGHFHEIHNSIQTQEIINNEVKTSKLIIESELRNKVEIFAYPNGNCQVLSQEILEKNKYKVGLALGNTMVPESFNQFMMPRLTPDHKFVKFKKQLQ